MSNCRAPVGRSSIARRTRREPLTFSNMLGSISEASFSFICIVLTLSLGDQALEFFESKLPVDSNNCNYDATVSTIVYVRAISN
jgi:hypothetical protein